MATVRQSLSNGRKQLPAPLDQPADHSGVEDVKELLRCTNRIAEPAQVHRRSEARTDAH